MTPGQQEISTTRGRMAAYWLTGLGLTLLLVSLHGQDWRGSVQLHTNMEIVATMLAAVVGAMSLVRFYSKKDNTFLFIGAGFLGMAFLDGYHALVTSQFFRPYMPSDLPSLIPWSWVASRQFLAILMFLSWFAWLREERLGETGKVGERAVYFFSAAFTLASFLFFAFMPLPPAYYPEIVFHRPEEFGPAIFFLAALVGYLKKGRWRDDSFEHWLVLSLIVGFVGQAVFMSRSGQLFDYQFDLAHLLKKVSYVCVLTGLLINMFTIFRHAEASDARFRGAIESLQEGFALYDSDDRLSVYNDEFVRLHSGIQDIIRPGMPFEELIKESVKRGKIADAIGREEEFIRDRIAQHLNPSDMVLRELTDGTWYIINEARTPEGGIAVTQTDITELKDAEKALRESEALTRRIMEASPVGVLIATREGRHLFVNDRALEIQGVTREELFASNAGSYYADPGLRAKLKNELYETGYTPPTEVELVKPDGEHYFVILSSTLTQFENRKAHLTYMYDITDRKQVEQDLQESQARLKAIIDTVPALINLKDRNGRYVMTNRYHTEFFGLEPDGLIGKTSAALNKEHGEWVAEKNRAVIEKGEIIPPYDYQMTDGKGRVRELLTTKVPLKDLAGKIIGVVSTSIDITERKEMDRLKREFISTVSHELRTPLTSIRGSLGLISGGAVGKVSKKALEMIAMAEKNTESVINLVNDILDMEKLDSGSMEFRFKAVDLTRLVKHGIEINRGYADQYNIEFVLVESAEGFKVHGDSDRLIQVLANLLSNAAKFSPEGENVEIAVSRQNGLARVSVSDRGPGIPEDFRDNVFAKFTQADSSDTRKAGGTGLGLNISKTIVDKHGGTIGFDTEAGVGTTFYFELPILDEAAEAAAKVGP